MVSWRVFRARSYFTTTSECEERWRAYYFKFCSCHIHCGSFGPGSGVCDVHRNVFAIMYVYVVPVGYVSTVPSFGSNVFIHTLSNLADKFICHKLSNILSLATVWEKLPLRAVFGVYDSIKNFKDCACI